MKRNRAEPAPQTPAKNPRRYAHPNPHQKLPQQLPHKPRGREAEEKRASPPGDVSRAPAAAAAAAEEEWAPHAGWDAVGEFVGTWSSWGVEEEKLLGWFPFVDEDFNGAGAFWEEEGCCYCYYHDDLWHLQHIHEVPPTRSAE